MIRLGSWGEKYTSAEDSDIVDFEEEGRPRLVDERLLNNAGATEADLFRPRREWFGDPGSEKGDLNGVERLCAVVDRVPAAREESASDDGI